MPARRTAGEVSVVLGKRKLVLRLGFEEVEAIEDTFDCSIEDVGLILETGKVSKVTRIFAICAKDDLDLTEAMLLIAGHPEEIGEKMMKLFQGTLNPGSQNQGKPKTPAAKKKAK